MIEIKFTRLAHGDGLPIPQYASDAAAGMDITSAEELLLEPGKRHAFATGLAIEIPHGFEVQVRPRSGLAIKHGITCLNTPGLIDAGYRDELKVLLVNLDPTHAFDIARGDRIAQLKADGVQVIDPAEGEMACGEFGPGRLPEPQAIMEWLARECLTAK